MIPDEYLHLRTLTECYLDVQAARIGIQNRVKSGTVYPEPLAAVNDLLHSEKLLAPAIRKALKVAAPDVYAWTKQVVGLGELSVGQLLGHIGPPAVAYPHHWEGSGEARVLVADEPYLRTLSQLRAYCGHGDPSRRRRAGMDQSEALALGNPRAKRIVHLIAEGCVRCAGSGHHPCDPMVPPPSSHSFNEAHDESSSLDDAPRGVGGGGGGAVGVAHTKSEAPRRRSPYRDIYDGARERYADRDWTDSHQHAAALRLVGKVFLSDLHDVALASAREVAA